MGQGTHIYLLGDRIHDINSSLRGLLRIDHDPILEAFFERAYHILRVEVGKLPLKHRKQIDRFSSIQDLLVLYDQGRLHPSFHQALICTYQLGSFISQCSLNGGLYPQSQNSYFVGVCTGALTAAAICSCGTLLELLPAAVHTIGVAFRTNLCAMDRGRCIELSTDSISASWSFTISGLSAKTVGEVLANFSCQYYLPTTSQPYLSITSEHDVTVSGPPSVLSHLRQQSKLSKYRIINAPLYAPYHAPHLFSNHDVETILETTSAKLWLINSTSLSAISSATGKLMVAGNFRSLLKAALEDILLKPVCWEDVIQGISYVARFAMDSRVTLHPLGTTTQPALCDNLKRRGYSVAISSGQESDSSYQSPPIPVDHAQRVADICQPSHTSRGTSARSKIAIVGMSGRFPDAEDPAAFWNLLSQGLDVHRVVPPSRWNATTHVDITCKRKNTSATPYGCWLNNPGLFDAKFFNMSRREAPEVDPASRLALMTAYEAMEQAGMVPDATPSTQKDRVGVFYGVTSNDWMETNSAQNIDTYFIPGGCRAFIPGRINYFFKFSGPSYSLDTACSSSLAAIHVACNSLWQGDIDTAIAGGTNVLTNPDYTAGLDRGRFLSRTGNCKTFDDGADGYCRGEGVCTVILKHLDDAIADNDPIQGIILGAYTNHSAEAESITRPHVDAQKAIFQKILNGASINPSDISYIEMHGTGTQLGDLTEMESVLEIFAPTTMPYIRGNDQPLYLGSAKANIGHGEAASGVTSLAKVLLMMKHDMIPPHCGIKSRINQKFPKNLRERNVFIANKLIPWQRPQNEARRVFINNFSAAGGNSALLLENAPPEAIIHGADPRSSHIVAVSAKCATSLKGNVNALLSFLHATPVDQVPLPALSYTTTARRIHHPHRVIVRGADLAGIKSQLLEALNHDNGAVWSKSASEITFAFTGNGSQYPGMGGQLFENFSSFRLDIIRFDQLAQCQGYPSFISMCAATTGDIEEFTPLTVQIATVCLEVALARLWASWGIVPKSVVGHSLGEYAALNIAGVLSDSDTIYLVGKRAQLLQDRCSRGTHSMLAVNASSAITQQYLKGKRYEVACINGPDDVVLSGTVNDIREVQASLNINQLKATTLQVPYAFHSAQIDPILNDFELEAKGVTFHKPTIPVICPLTSTVISHIGTFGPAYLSSHCRQTVNMLGALRVAKESGIITHQNIILEIGPQPIFSRMVKAALGTSTTILPSLKRNQDTWPILTATLSAFYAAGMNVNWREYHRDFNVSHKVLQLPAYSWELKEYWIQYVNDWSLRKGDPINTRDTSPAVHSVVPKLESTTVQTVINDSMLDQRVSITVETDLNRRDLNSLARGHKVDSIPLCTPSLYAEIALTLGNYILNRYQPKIEDCLINITDMVIEKALIVHGEGQPQVLQTSVEFDLRREMAACHFSSVNLQGVARRVLHYILSREGGSRAVAPQNQRIENAVLSPPKTPIPLQHSSVSTTSAVASSYTSTTELEPPIRIQEAAPYLQSFSTSPQVRMALQIILEESGIALSELTDTSILADMGVDSLLTLLIASRFKDELGVDIDLTTFGTLPTIKHLKDLMDPAKKGATTEEALGSLLDKAAVEMLPEKQPNSSSTIYTRSRTVITPMSEISTAQRDENSLPALSFDGDISIWGIPENEPSNPITGIDFGVDKKIEQSPGSIRPAISVILQGRPRTDLKTLILFPDGAGSASSYASLPSVRSGLAIIGLNCPYNRHPEEMVCTLDELMDSYLAEVRRRQPFGPYHLGGWSSGGILAYRAAQRLIQEGEEVQTLVLIDAPAPQGLDALPQRWYDHCASVGIFDKAMPGVGSSTSRAPPPEWLVPHFRASINVLHDYHADPLPKGFTPKVSLIWASECILDGVGFSGFKPSPGDPEGIKFLTEKRSDFSAGGWTRLFPDDEVTVEVMEGANHFSMMQVEHSGRLAAFLNRATD